MSSYCSAEHENAELGCYGEPNHEGKHWRWSKDRDHPSTLNHDRKPSGPVWEWPNEAEAPEPEPVFTQAEVGILLTALLPIEQFFPDLRKKLEMLQANG